MKGGSPAYAFHQSEGFLSQGTNVDHVKPLTYDGNSGHENFSNLYKVSGGARKKRSLRKRSRSVRKRISKRVCDCGGNCGGTKRSGCSGGTKRNRRATKSRLSRKKRK
jgi:hypothetical protein